MTFVIQAAWATTFSYDRLHRLTSVVYDNGTVVLYQYDAAGNRKRLVSYRPADVNGDGAINALDVAQFVAVLFGAATNPAHVLASDLDNSGTADGVDIQFLVTAILAQ